jgi:hypothetical protein
MDPFAFLNKGVTPCIVHTKHLNIIVDGVEEPTTPVSRSDETVSVNPFVSKLTTEHSKSGLLQSLPAADGPGLVPGPGSNAGIDIDFSDEPPQSPFSKSSQPDKKSGIPAIQF